MQAPVLPTRKYHAVFVSENQIKEADCCARNAKQVEAIIKGQDPLALIKMIIIRKDEQ